MAHAQLQKSEQDAARSVSDNHTETLVGSLRAEIARHQAMIAMNDAQGLLKRSIGVAHLLMAKPGWRGGSYLPGLLEA